MEQFVHLHVHSHYSLLDGMIKIKDLVKTAKKLGFSSIALTDTGAMYGAIEFYQACLENEIKPIIGFETRVTTKKLSDINAGLPIDSFELVLLAENFDGYRNLMKLCSEAALNGLHNGIGHVTVEMLEKYKSHVIALSGGMSSEVSHLLSVQKDDDARAAALKYQEIFGQDNFYLELQDHPALEGQVAVNAKLISLSKETGIPAVVTRDVHYLKTDDAEAQDVLRCISLGTKVDEVDREDLRHVDRSLNSAEDIASRFRHVKEALENTAKIAQRISMEIPLDVWHFAPVEIPKDIEPQEYLRTLVYEAAPKFYPDMPTLVVERLDYELDVIGSKGYVPYFLCVSDYVNYAKANGIVESTRGSAAGSLVSYVLGITTVDPIRFQLPFERFLNPFRPSAPDIDTDFADDRREEMIEYVTKKYGKEKVAQIITFGTMAARASVRDVGRALGFSYGFCDQVAKLIPQGAQGFPMTIERALAEEPDLKTLYDSNEDVHRLLNLAQKVEGCARHTSIHAAGVVISPTDLTDFCPVQRETGGDKLVTQYEMRSVETAGVLKNDFLGIRNLSILGNSVEIVQKTTGDEVDIYNLPLDDDKVFEMLARGETMGVFQLSSTGMTRWLKELRPTNIEDIMAMVALYRPGPLDFIPEYIDRKHHPEKVDYPHPDLEDILQMSLGLLIYQDDVMLTAIKLAGYDWLEADKFRKAMGKKIPELMDEQEQKFKKGCIANNIPSTTADGLWERIKPFATYAFNKAHAASYGIVAYQTAYMKAHYPVQYMTAVLQAEFGDSEKVAAIVRECERMHIEVLPPDINESFRNFAMVSKHGEPGRIRFGLNAIKNVGEHICDEIYRERKDHGPYTSLENLLERVQDKDLNKKSLESLIQCGALDIFGVDRGVLLANSENILNFGKHLKEKHSTNQGSLFSGTSIEVDSKITLKSAPAATLEQKLIWEKKLLGLYVSAHPFDMYLRRMRESLTLASDIPNTQRDQWVFIGGVIDSIKKKLTKKGTQMLFATIQDQSGQVELLVFPKTYEETKNIWKEGDIVYIVGKTSREEGDTKVFVERAGTLTPQVLEMVAQQIGTGFKKSSHELMQKKNDASGDNTYEEPLTSFDREGSITLLIDPKKVAHIAPILNEILQKFSGTETVYIRVGANTIKSDKQITISDALIEALCTLLSKDSVIVEKSS